MSNKNLNRSRRAFLEFLSKTGIASQAVKGSSLLAGLLANRYAQANNGVKRVVFVYTPLGSPNGLWLPSGSTLNVATKAYEGLQPVCHFHETNVFDGGFGQIWKALSEIRYVENWTSDSIDHQIAQVLSIASPFSTLHFGVQTKASGFFDSFTRKNLQMIPPLEGPGQTYTHLFGREDGARPERLTAVADKQNVLDAHLQSLNCSRSKLSADEVSAIDQYEASLSALKSKIGSSNADPKACQRPDWNAQGFDAAGSSGQMPFAHEAFLQAEIIGHALACGLTNVATLQLSNDQGAFYGHDTEFKHDLHQASCGAGPQQYAEMVNYLSRCVAYLIRHLAEKDDPAVPGTKLLDNTVVLQVSNQGHGPDHSGDRGPNVIATRMPSFNVGLATPQKSGDDVNLRVLQTVAAGLGLEQYIGKESHHCIWPCGERWGGINTDFLS